MDKYKCIKPLSVTKYDENEMVTEDEEKLIEVGSEWTLEEDNLSIFGEIRLESESEWLDVCEETLKECFEVVATYPE
ncbi:hypothetical protein [Aquibacillus saliphilus]|uniref:hypothetical protein n=1 Tax=Aquibacillus saliphilus TaxID=1909422 RepID=UPI001CF00860|nr:hypothetical protein [Aquibacillus saliphilus]